MDHKIFSKAILLCNVSSEFRDDFENALTIFDKFSDFLSILRKLADQIDQNY